MQAPLFVRALTPEEQARLETLLRSSDAFVLRRAQILLASARGQSTGAIARALGCSIQTARNVINAFHTRGLASLARRSNRPKSAKPVLDEPKCERLKHLLHQSPRTLGKPTGLWTLALAAQACFEQGITDQPLSDETIRRALIRLGVGWKRAKHWISSPDPQYALKKSGATA